MCPAKALIILNDMDIGYTCCGNTILLNILCLFVCIYIVVYCDYAASGKSLQFIEDYILKEVLPVYGNTHTTTNVTSLQSTLYR